MSEAPERIWWNGVRGEGGYTSTVRFAAGFEYVRADRIEELEAKLAKLARAAKPFAAIKIKDGRSQPGEIGRTDVTNLRAALAELKGEDRG
jgi:hypothetical protein